MRTEWRDCAEPSRWCCKNTSVRRKCSGRDELTSGWLLLIIPGLIWGASFLFIAEGLRSIGPNGVAFVRICIGFATLALFPAARKPVARADWKSVAWVGLLWFAFPLSMFPYAEQRVSSAL